MGSNCEAYKPKNPLPFRRLKEYANGIWDETRKEFYPFNIVFVQNAGAFLLAKPGIRYYVKCLSLGATNAGDKASATPTVNMTQNGGTRYCGVSVAATVAASNVNQNANVFFNLGILCDTNKAIGASITSTSACITVVYAEIPDDPAGGPVVVS